MPFKNEKTLGDSYKKAMAHFIGLKKKLDTNQNLKEKYMKFMNEYISVGHVVEAPNNKNAKY